MKLLFVTDAWFPQVNGVVTTMSTVIELFEEQGHEVKVIEPSAFRSVPMPTYPEIRLSVNVWKVGKLIKGFNPDRVHIVTEGSLGMAAVGFLRAHGYKYTTAFHTKFPEYAHARFPFLSVELGYKIMKNFHGNSHKVLTPTEGVKKELNEWGLDNVVTWSRGVDTKTFKPMTKKERNPLADLPAPIYLYVGRVAKEKNIQAFLDVDIEGTKVVVGDGPLRESIEKQYPDVQFVGYKKGRDLALHFAAADVFVFPSLTDTFGVVMLESMACGTPVAAFPVSGPVDVVNNGVTGFLNDDLKQAMQDALTLNPKDCVKQAKSNSWKKTAQLLLDTMVDKGESRIEMAKSRLKWV